MAGFWYDPDPQHLQAHPGFVWVKSRYSEAIAWRKVRLTKQRNVDLTTDGLWAMPLNSCLPLFFWADSSSPPHLSFCCSSAKFLFPAPPPDLRHSFYATRCLAAHLSPAATAGAG